MNSNITLQQLIYAVAVDSHGSFVDAAVECKVSQPALSMQIRKLENTLGVTLFDRSRQPVRPTDVGRRIITQARHVIREADRIQETADVAQGEMRGEFHLGVSSFLASWLLPPALRSFSVDHRHAIVIVHELETNALIERLKQNELDAALTLLPVSEDEFFQRGLFNEPLLACVPRSHPLYASERIRIEDLVGEALLLPDEVPLRSDRGPTLYPPNIRVDTAVPIQWKGGTFDTFRRLSEQGAGIALLPRLMADEMGATGSADMLRQFAENTPSLNLGLIYALPHEKEHVIDALAAAIMNRSL